MSIPVLRQPFPSLVSKSIIGFGSTGVVFAINRSIVFKCPKLVVDPTPDQAEESEACVQRIEREKAALNVLMQYPHQNIFRGLLCIPEGIFLERLECTLSTYLQTHEISSIPLDRQCGWIRQIASALQFLESLGYTHGDLRPENILLHATDTVKLCDFDSTVKTGERRLTMSVPRWPFYNLADDREIPRADAMSEQYALGSCIYTIRTGHEPYHDLDGPAAVDKLSRNELPSTAGDELFGDITLRCWRGHYQTIAELEQDILERLRRWIEESDNGTALEESLGNTEPSLVAEREEFVKHERERPARKAL